MENVYAYENPLVLKKALNINIKNLRKDIHTSENSIDGRRNRKKIRYVKWILKLIKSERDFTYQELLEMVDLKTQAKKKDLNNALGKYQKANIEDSIKSMAWLRNMIEITSM